jgi:hypothetical protein
MMLRIPPEHRLSDNRHLQKMNNYPKIVET